MTNEDRKLITNIAKGAAEQVVTRMLRDADNYLPVEMPPEIRARLKSLERIQLWQTANGILLSITFIVHLVLT